MTSREKTILEYARAVTRRSGGVATSYDLERLCILARRLHRVYERLATYAALRLPDEAAEAEATAEARVIIGLWGATLEVQRDPRGWPLNLVWPDQTIAVPPY